MKWKCRRYHSIVVFSRYLFCYTYTNCEIAYIKNVNIVTNLRYHNDSAIFRVI